MRLFATVLALALLAAAPAHADTAKSEDGKYQIDVPSDKGWTMVALGGVWLISPPKVNGAAQDAACVLHHEKDSAAASQWMARQLSTRYKGQWEYGQRQPTDLVLSSRLLGATYDAVAPKHDLLAAFASAPGGVLVILCGIGKDMKADAKAAILNARTAMFKTLRPL